MNNNIQWGLELRKAVNKSKLTTSDVARILEVKRTNLYNMFKQTKMSPAIFDILKETGDSAFIALYDKFISLKTQKLEEQTELEKAYARIRVLEQEVLKYRRSNEYYKERYESPRGKTALK